jgi:glutamyl/glutaminyl-tRNA synthetase
VFFQFVRKWEIALDMPDVRTYRRTRFAPTPSGYLHAGNILSFILTAGLARRHGAAILLRIDDLDITRVRQQYVDDIFDTLSFLDIPWDEGPRNAEELTDHWSQRNRLRHYSDILCLLREKGLLYACACTRTRMSGGGVCACAAKCLDFDLTGISWRLLTDMSNRIYFRSLYSGIEEFQLPASVQRAVMRKRDGDAAYHIASVSDDIYFDVDLVVRGADLLDATILQSALASRLEGRPFDHLTFFHHSLIYDISGRKLSKSAGDASVSDLRSSGMGRREVFGTIASYMGIEERPDRWQDLFDLICGHYGIDL